MTISLEICESINKCYSHYQENNKKSEMSYEVLKYKHSTIIFFISKFLKCVNVVSPKIGDRVFTITDMTQIGKGVFVSEHYYNEHGFVSEMCADDAYGFITHWVSFDEIDALKCNPLVLQQ